MARNPEEFAHISRPSPALKRIARRPSKTMMLKRTVIMVMMIIIETIIMMIVMIITTTRINHY